MTTRRAAATHLLGLTQPKLSGLRHHKLAGFPVELLVVLLIAVSAGSCVRERALDDETFRALEGEWVMSTESLEYLRQLRYPHATFDEHRIVLGPQRGCTYRTFVTYSGSDTSAPKERDYRPAVESCQWFPETAFVRTPSLRSFVGQIGFSLVWRELDASTATSFSAFSTQALVEQRGQDFALCFVLRRSRRRKDDRLRQAALAAVSRTTPIRRTSDMRSGDLEVAIADLRKPGRLAGVRACRPCRQTRSAAWSTACGTGPN